MQKNCCTLFSFKALTLEDIPQEIQELVDPFPAQKNFFISRQALKDALKTWGIVPENWKKLEIVQNNHLRFFPEILVSLSHTQHIGAAYIANQNSCQSVGVDIEFTGRKIPEGTLKFFMNSDDESQSPLVLWTQKEAAFKALSPLFPDLEMTLKMITVNAAGRFFFRDKEGEVSVEKIVFDGEELWLAKASL